MQPINKTTRPNLVTQIEFFKNYYEHRKRVESTLLRSPLKKSISYDESKQILHEYIKNRKEYTFLYNRKETLKENEMRDFKMIRNILDYDSKIFVFSLNKYPRTHSTLHHNSIVTSNRKNESIDSANEKLHFRISKAKSLYSHLNPYKSMVSSTHQFYDVKQYPKNKIQHSFQKKFNTETSNEQLEFSLNQVFTRSHRTQAKQMHNDGQHYRYKNQSNIHEMKMNMLRSQFSQPSRKICERARREKLAEKLYQRKQRIQKNILSKFKTS